MKAPFNGKKMAYTATASETFLKNEAGEPIGAMWSVAYTKSGKVDPTTRPVTFVFNGGPGSASVWLHLGFFGPKVVQVDSDAKEDDGGAPYPIIDNPHGLAGPYRFGLYRPNRYGLQPDDWQR